MEVCQEGTPITAAQTKYTDCVHRNIKMQHVYVCNILKAENKKGKRQTIGHGY